MTIRLWSEQLEWPIPAAGEYQIWMAWMDSENPDDFRGILSEAENLRIQRYLNPLSADRFTVSRGILRILLGRMLKTAPGLLIFRYGVHGKPELAGEVNGKFSFNVSHSGSLVVFAIANGSEVGVDIEEVHPVADLEASASIFLSTEELAEFKLIPDPLKLERFFTLWTCKEAILKAIGTGFTGPVKNILASFSNPDQNKAGLSQTSANERLMMINPAEGFIGALACV